MSQDVTRLLPAELLAVAGALRKVRTRLGQLLASGHWPEGSFSDLSTVHVQGLDVANALERLADVPPPKSPSPYDPSERR